MASSPSPAAWWRFLGVQGLLRLKSSRLYPRQYLRNVNLLWWSAGKANKKSPKWEMSHGQWRHVQTPRHQRKSQPWAPCSTSLPFYWLSDAFWCHSELKKNMHGPHFSMTFPRQAVRTVKGRDGEVSSAGHVPPLYTLVPPSLTHIPSQCTSTAFPDPLTTTNLNSRFLWSQNCI